MTNAGHRFLAERQMAALGIEGDIVLAIAKFRLGAASPLRGQRSVIMV
jgi:hypothetical protein